MTAEQFRSCLRDKLAQAGSTVLLRIAPSSNPDQPVELDGHTIVKLGLELASRFSCSAQNDVVLLLLPHSVELFLLHIGLVLKGRTPAILAWPTSRVDPLKYQRNLVHQLRTIPARELITLPQLAANLGPELDHLTTHGCEVQGCQAFDQSFGSAFVIESGANRTIAARQSDARTEAVFLQFSGGTTGAQKAVPVTSLMLTDQLARLARKLNLGPQDCVVSWLPLYHDMGLIACLWLPLWTGSTSLHFAASDWLLDPGRLFRFIERYKGSFTWLPNFAYSYLATQVDRAGPVCDLSSMKAWVNCSEPVRSRSMLDFSQAYGAWGVRPECLHTSYAMAENVFAVTHSDFGVQLSTVPRTMVGHSNRVENIPAFNTIDDVYVSSGRALASTEIRVTDRRGSGLPDGQAGEIQIRTPSLFSGYWAHGEMRKEVISNDGWYRTGDYGFVWAQELFIIGRLKDIVIVGGQNVFPEDVEAIVNTVDGIYPGRVVAFGVEQEASGTEALAVVAEMRGAFEPVRAATIEREIQSIVLAAIGVAPRFARVKPERWIVKSTAGKISRIETRARFLIELSTPHSMAVSAHTGLQNAR